jgi:hypothetical protein
VASGQRSEERSPPARIALEQQLSQSAQLAPSLLELAAALLDEPEERAVELQLAVCR